MLFLMIMLKNLNIFGSAEPSRPRRRSRFHVVNKSAITALLTQAHKHKLFFTVSFENHKGLYNTALLGVYAEQGFVAFDELTPSKGHKLFLEEKEARVTGRLEGVELRFSARLLEAGSKAGVAFYKVALPEELVYKQKREYFRVTLLGSPVSFQGRLGEDEGILLQGHLYDLSLGGAKVVLEQTAPLSAGDILSACRIRLPDGVDIPFSLRVCYAGADKSGGGTVLGGQFRDLQKSDENRIARFISDVQREKAKKS